MRSFRRGGMTQASVFRRCYRQRGRRVWSVAARKAERLNHHTGVDVTGRYAQRLFDATDRAVVVYRPDFHGFGSARTFDDALDLVRTLDLTQKVH